MSSSSAAAAPVARTKKGRRKFDKKTAHRFTLMHRSQLDPLYDEDGASKLVLHPQNEQTAEGSVYAELREAQDREQEQREDAAAKAAKAAEAAGLRHLSAVDDMGMPRDGYDYHQHIRPMGGGTFVGVDGKTRNASSVPGVSGATSSKVHAVLATRETEMPQDRMFEAITLTTDDMPDDVALALDSDYDDYDYDDGGDGSDSDRDGAATDAAQGRLIKGKDGVFEELQLDFIAAASEEPEDGEMPVFNFKEHIARLMRHADGQYSGDEGEGKWVRGEAYAEGDEYGEDDEEYEDGEDFDLEALGLTHLMVDKNSSGGGGGGNGRAGHGPADNAPRPRRDLDEAFDALLEREYEDDQIGDLDEELCAEDGLAETLSGIKLDADTMGDMMDRFLLADGQKKVPLTGEALHEQLLHVKEFVETRQQSRLEASALAAHNESESESESEMVLAAAGLTRANTEKAATVVDYDADDVPVLHASGKAATEKKAEIGWSREKRFLPRRLRRANEHDCESVVSTYSNLDNHPRLLGATRRDGRTTQVQRDLQEAPAAPFITLSKKTGLPIGMLGRYDDDDVDDSDSGEEENDQYGGDEDYGEESTPKANLGVKRAKKETPQEKRARKKAVKAERRARRQQKKMMKTEFKKEEKRQLQGTRASDGISITPLC